MKNTAPPVEQANEFVANWPAGRTLDYICVPFAAADPRGARDAFDELLRDLQIPDEVRLVAGCLHEKLDRQAHENLPARTEGYAGPQGDNTPAYGLGGRDNPNEAFLAMPETAAPIEES